MRMPAAAFTLVETAIERGYDLRLLCRELARATRDLLMVSVDATRLKDPDVAERVGARAGAGARREVLARRPAAQPSTASPRAEYDVRHSDHPRFQLEMALLRLMHLRKLLPLAELLEGGGARGLAPPAARPAAPPSARRRAGTAPAPGPRRRARAAPGASVALPVTKPPRRRCRCAAAAPARRHPSPGRRRCPTARATRSWRPCKAGKVFFYNAVVAQAYRIDVTPARITFAFLPNQKVPRSQCEENRGWLEALGAQTFGRVIPVHVATADPAEAAPAGRGRPPSRPPRRRAPASKSPVAGPSDDELRKEALSDPTVQAMLEIFPVERTKIEEM